MRFFFFPPPLTPHTGRFDLLSYFPSTPHALLSFFFLSRRRRTPRAMRRRPQATSRRTGPCRHGPSPAARDHAAAPDYNVPRLLGQGRRRLTHATSPPPLHATAAATKAHPIAATTLGAARPCSTWTARPIAATTQDDSTMPTTTVCIDGAPRLRSACSAWGCNQRTESRCWF